MIQIFQKKSSMNSAIGNTIMLGNRGRKKKKKVPIKNSFSYNFQGNDWLKLHCAESGAYVELCQISKMKPFAKFY